MKKDEILEYLRSSKNEFMRDYGIDKIALIGSFARGEEQEKSDIDIIYSLKDGKKWSFDKYLEFEDKLRKKFNRDIDLIYEKRLNPLVRIYALKEMIYV